MSPLPTILVIVGITGDLSKRKLLPAIEQIAKAGALPGQFRVVGITRRDASVNEVLVADSRYEFVKDHLEMYKMDLANKDDYAGLKQHLDTIESSFGKKAQRLFYLSVPPQFSRPIVEQLGRSGFGDEAMTKLLLEKPFGVDLSSARELIDETRQYFAEDQLYRIDHYLAKEMAQNLIVFRNDNALFKQTWNSHHIDRIEIVASEKIGIEGRVDFYEQTGALRDLVQSHLLQLAALVLMDLPENIDMKQVPRYRLDALRRLQVSLTDSGMAVTRGQYNGYRHDIKNDRSMTETYVDMTLSSSDKRWQDVPIRIMTGKAMAEKATFVRIVYKTVTKHEANELIISLQPNEGVELQLWTKVPGYDHKLEKHSLGIAFKDHFPQLPEAYEQVLLDAIRGVHTLFASSDEVIETWRIIDPVQQLWQMNESALLQYEQSTDIASITP